MPNWPDPVSSENYAEILPTYELTRSLGVGFKVKLTENAFHYTNRIYSLDSKFTSRQKKEIISSFDFLAKRKNISRIEKALLKQSIELLQDKGRKISCRTPFERVFLFPDGSVFSCLHFEEIGNLNIKSLGNIWKSKRLTNTSIEYSW